MSQLDHALLLVRAYLAECADREYRSDLRTKELTEVIRSCVECIGVQFRGQVEGRDAPAQQTALRHALGYVDERFDR